MGVAPVAVSRGAIRLVSLACGAALGVIGLGFLRRDGWATELWPFELLETRLGFIFLGSIALALSMSWLWIAASGETRAAAPLGFDLAVMFGCMSCYLFYRAGRQRRSELVTDGVVTAVPPPCTSWPG